jgi:hypothetical protein
VSIKQTAALALSLVVVWALSVFPSAASQELLVNGGFEAPLGSEWRVYGGELSRVPGGYGYGYEASGYAARFDSQSLGTKWFYQVVPISPGGTYTFAGWAVKDDPNIYEIFLRISWYESVDGFGSEISHIDSTSSLTDDQPGYRFLSTAPVAAPEGAHSARVRAILVPATAQAATAYFDDMSFTVPLPPPQAPNRIRDRRPTQVLPR